MRRATSRAILPAFFSGMSVLLEWPHTADTSTDCMERGANNLATPTKARRPISCTVLLLPVNPSTFSSSLALISVGGPTGKKSLVTFFGA